MDNTTARLPDREVRPGQSVLLSACAGLNVAPASCDDVPTGDGSEPPAFMSPQFESKKQLHSSSFGPMRRVRCNRLAAERHGGNGPADGWVKFIRRV